MAILGVDIGGTRIKAGVVDSAGRVRAPGEVSTPADLDGFQAAFGTLLRTAIAAAGPVEAAGVGCKGFIDAATTRILDLPGTLHFLEGAALAEMVRGALGRDLPVAADNDARAAMAGEVAWGAARGRRNALLLTLGTGVGGAAVVDGRLLRGARGAGGHFGHLTMDPSGAPCICGNRGCLETFFSAGAIEAEARSAVYRGCSSALTERFRGAPESLTCRDVFEAAAAGDALARWVVERATGVLGAALAGLAMAFDPELIILGGQISAAGGALFDPLRRELAWRTRMLNREVPLVRAEAADATGVAGAAALALSGAL